MSYLNGLAEAKIKIQTKIEGEDEAGHQVRGLVDLMCWWSCQPISGLLLSVSGL